MTTWNNGTSRGTEHNKRVRGGGTWGAQSSRLYRHQRARYRQEMGRGTWADRDRRLVWALHRRERGGGKIQGRTTLRQVAAGVLILGAVLVMSPATRGTGVMILAFVGLIVYVIIRRKRA